MTGVDFSVRAAEAEGWGVDTTRAALRLKDVGSAGLFLLFRYALASIVGFACTQHACAAY